MSGANNSALWLTKRVISEEITLFVYDNKFSARKAVDREYRYKSLRLERQRNREGQPTK
jgi:hypothetical protein